MKLQLPGTFPHQITLYTRSSPLIPAPLRFAVVSDLHNGPFEDVVDVLRTCDAILVPGDLIDRHHPGLTYAQAFLEEAPKLAPVFVSLGNHEWKSVEAAAFRKLLNASSVTVLDNRIEHFHSMVIGGWSSVHRKLVDPALPEKLAQEDGFRLLLCHHPEWFPKYVKALSIDLTISGHAHGGQVQLGGHGLYAPNQLLLPSLTDGWYEDGRLLVSRGMTNSSHWAPRINNPTELLVLTLLPGEESYQ